MTCAFFVAFAHFARPWTFALIRIVSQINLPTGLQKAVDASRAERHTLRYIFYRSRVDVLVLHRCPYIGVTDTLKLLLESPAVLDVNKKLQFALPFIVDKLRP